MSAIFYLLTNIFMTGTSIIGCATIVNKIGKFCKIIDENKKDGFRLAFDTVMLESINDMNNCVESISSIGNNLNKIIFIFYDITIGNKFIKKDKDGKLIICNKSKVFSGFKDKINELNTKVRKYQDELNKIRKPKDKNQNNVRKNKSNNSSDDSSYISSNSSNSSDSSNSSNSSNSSDNSSDQSLNDKSIKSSNVSTKYEQTYSDVSSDDSSDNENQNNLKKKNKSDEFYL